MPVLGKFGERVCEDRGIGAETAAKYGVYTASQIDGQTVPDPNGKVIAFPFFDGDAVVAEKYRAAGKRFWQKAGGKRTFWNAQVMDDPALRDDNGPALVITEGEFDALAAIEAGHPFSVSVPDGAPAVPEGDDPEELPEATVEDEKAGKFQFMYVNRRRLAAINRFIIAVDNDRPGKRLAAELVRRLTPAKCSFVTYPEGCKDLNDVLKAHGREGVMAVINGAKPYPVKGVYRLGDFPELESRRIYRTGISKTLDDALGLWLGELMIVTGVPGHGKSSWMLQVCAALTLRYGWNIGVASFEIPVVPELRDKLRGLYIRHTQAAWSPDDVRRADKLIQDHWSFITSLPKDDDEMTLEWLLDRAQDCVIRDGIKLMLIDPWNEVEHCRRRDETEAQYLNRAIRAWKRFALNHEVIVVIVAHPTKDFARGGDARALTLYDIDGGAAWVNKPDHGVVVDVPDPDTEMTVIHVKKVRFRGTGKRGAEVKLRYLPHCEGYEDHPLNQEAPPKPPGGWISRQFGEAAE